VPPKERTHKPRRIDQSDIAHGEAIAAMEEQVVGTAVASQSAWRRSSADSRVKLGALAIDRAGALDGDIGCVDGEEQRPVSVGAAEKFSRGSDVQGHMAFEFDRTDLESAGGNQYDSTAIPMACVYGRLDCRCVECSAVPFRSVLANVVDVSAEIVCTGIAFYLRGGKPWLSCETTSE
jgi:hypothetical protein